MYDPFELVTIPLRVIMSEGTSVFCTTSSPYSGVILRGFAGVTLMLCLFAFSGNLKVFLLVFVHA